MDKKNRRAHLRGSSNPYAKLTEDEVAGIKVELTVGRSLQDIATDFGVQPCTISAIKNNRNWSHVPWPSPGDTEIQQYAKAVKQLAEPLFPETFAEWGSV